jgi:cytochrome d ubiquinol oxidase subunit I
MLTSQAVTGAGGIPVGYATLALVYLGVASGVAWILRRLARMPLDLPIDPTHPHLLGTPSRHAPV